MIRVECPVCNESFKEYNDLDDHFKNCLAKNRGHLPPQRLQSVQDSLFVIKMMWDEEQIILKKKKEEELLTLEFLKLQKSSQMKCNHCCESFFFNDLIHLDCKHRFCKLCLHKDLQGRIQQKQYHDFTCLTCEIPLTPRNLFSVLSRSEIEKLEEKQLYAYMKKNPDLFVFCPHCNKGFEKVKQTEEEVRSLLVKRNLPNDNISIHREINRILCRYCKQDFCMNCFICPYHEEYTCESYQNHLVTTRCRYCDEAVTIVDLLSPIPLQNICSSENCQRKKKITCDRILKCKHFCFGIRGEKDHLICLHEECEEERKRLELVNINNNSKKKKLKTLEIRGNDYCNICWIEALSDAPCIQLKCGHIFHYECVIEKIERKWGTPMITFGFLNCPLCKVVMTHKSLKPYFEPIEKMRKVLHKKMLKRLKFEGMDKDDELRKGRKFYKKKKEFAEEKLAYYQCHECEVPYFGGMRSCEDVGGDRNFKKEELVCGGCVAKKLSITKTCPLHGHEFIEWKCKFCCSLSTYFCWGSTHFCDKCHKEQVKTQKITKMKKEELPKCKGIGKCPSGGDHPPNGEEYPIGCSICRKNMEF